MYSFLFILLLRHFSWNGAITRS